jgi:hypothetical protein
MLPYTCPNPPLLKRGACGRSCQPSGLDQRGARGMDGLGLIESLQANVALHVADMDRLRDSFAIPLARWVILWSSPEHVASP